ncbi:MAG: ABC transporter ATP-binding protein [Chloroflexi bacterium]|nr:ABC transporter ATP-binding protein [Chloroflexota bacterium]
MSYGPRRALRGLSFSLGAGRILGFLGPNGAGKTTAIRILTTVLEPTAGHFEVGGIRSDEPDRIRGRIGVLPENLGFPRHMTGLEYLTYFGELFGLAQSAARERAIGLLDDVGLAQRGTSRIGSYSHGMRQRLGIARALVNEPLVIFLDEPTLGLDPRGQQELLALIRRVASERGASIVLCSHSLPEIEGICDDVVILNLGQVVAAGTVAEVIDQAGSEVLHVRVDPASAERARDALLAVVGVADASVSDALTGRVVIRLGEAADGPPDRPGIRDAVLAALVAAEIPVISFGYTGNRLQDLFLQVTDEAIS